MPAEKCCSAHIFNGAHAKIIDERALIFGPRLVEKTKR